MEIKRREESKSSKYLLEKFRSFLRFIFNKRTWIIGKVIAIVIIFIIGLFFGLLISKFFGTLDNPSQKAVDLAHYLGVSYSEGYRAVLKDILSENIKIPFNYIRGQFSNPDKMFIDISFMDYQQLEYKRNRAIEKGVLIASDEDYVPATITYNGQSLNADMRLKGDWLDHLQGTKWSYRIKLKGEDRLDGMRTFSIQTPKVRNYLNEVVYHYMLKKEDVISLRYKFVEVIVNGKNMGIYALEEHFDKELIESNNRREGPIIRFSEDRIFEELFDSSDELFFPDAVSWNEHVNDEFSKFYVISTVDAFKSNQILEDPIKTEEFNRAKNILESFRRGEMKTSEVFDVELLAKYFAISTLTGGEHGSELVNIRFYYNPITSKLEPIGYDARGGSAYGLLEKHYTPKPATEPFYSLFFSDKIFYEKYIKELERISDEEYLDEIFNELDDELKKDVNIIHKEVPYYKFRKEMYYNNQKYIQDILNPVKAVNAYYQEDNPAERKIILYIGNLHAVPVEVLDATYNDSLVFESRQKGVLLEPRAYEQPVDYYKFEFNIPAGLDWNDSMASGLKVKFKIFAIDKIKEETVFAWSYRNVDFKASDFMRQDANLSFEEAFEVDEAGKIIYIKQGNWILNKSLVVPPGYTLACKERTTIDLIDGALILSYSPLSFSGSKDNPIKIISSDGTGQGLVVLNAKQSTLNYVQFMDLSNPSKDEWQQTGSITFYESPVKLNNVLISGARGGDDALNIVRSKFELTGLSIERTSADCFDSDFSKGVLKESNFIDCGNDGIDFSGSSVEIINLNIINQGDKGISVGEKSEVNLENIKIDGGYIGVASKDNSKITAEGLEISNCEYGFAVYQKKPEYGAAEIIALNVKMSNLDKNYIVEKGSSLSVNEDIILGGEGKVYEKLYPEIIK